MSDREQHIERSWEEFRRVCIRRPLTDAEEHELRRTFFAGASMMFQGLAGVVLRETWAMYRLFVSIVCCLSLLVGCATAPNHSGAIVYKPKAPATIGRADVGPPHEDYGPPPARIVKEDGAPTWRQWLEWPDEPRERFYTVVFWTFVVGLAACLSGFCDSGSNGDPNRGGGTVNGPYSPTPANCVNGVNQHTGQPC